MMAIPVGVKWQLLVVTFVLNCSIKQSVGVLFRRGKETSGLTEGRGESLPFHFCAPPPPFL